MAFMDHTTTPLNACSLEAIPEPVVKYADGRRAWPILVGCYQLVEGDGHRQGRLALHLVEAPTHQPEESEKDQEERRWSNMPTSLSFRTPYLIPQDDEAASSFSGVLDGKWFPKLATSGDNNTDRWWYATACASGEICVYALTMQDEEDSPSCPPCQIRQVGSSEASNQEALCLSLNWDPTATDGCVTSNNTQRLVSSYSNGQLAIHDVAFLAKGRVHLEEKHSWSAHFLFGNTPTEVWTACFANNDSDGRVILSGGDDAKCNIWDVRTNTMHHRPTLVLTEFDAGVTVVSAHPRKHHLVACGSYDESVALYDVRSPRKPLLRSSFGGGIWRIQWHPLEDDRLLLAAMHSGCRVVQLGPTDKTSVPSSVQAVKEFTNHESMAYGADWLICRHRHGYYEAAASCSFYDRAAYLWDTT